MVRTLTKANLDERKKLTALIDDFIEANSKEPIKSLEAFLKDLTIFLYKRYDKVDKNLLKELAIERLKALNIAFDVKNAELIYEKMLEAASITTAAALSVKPLNIVFDRVDIKAIKSMKQSFYWVADEYNKKITAEIKNVIEDVFRGEIPRAELATHLQEKYGEILKRDRRYFEGVADHIINQSQNIARVTEAIKYNIKAFKVVARMDERTSDICRSMNGRIISAEHLQRQVDAILSAKSIGEKKAAAEWRSGYHFGKLPKNFGLPPYHFRCRTMVFPVNLFEDTIDGKKVRYADKNRDDAIVHIDKSGVQRRVKKHIYDKLKQKHKLKDKEIIGILNDIKYISPHSKIHGRFIAQSGRGYVAVFEGEDVITMFPPTRGKKYFNDNAKPGKIVNIDTGETIERIKKWFELF